VARVERVKRRTGTLKDKGGARLSGGNQKKIKTRQGVKGERILQEKHLIEKKFGLKGETQREDLN